jgi:hypothetical protein
LTENGSSENCAQICAQPRCDVVANDF